MDKNPSKPAGEESQREVFAEVSLFGADLAGSAQNADCGCFSCDGNPCVK